MRTFLLFAFTFVAFHIHAIEIDSVQREKLIAEGRAELCNLLEYNTHVTSASERRYLVIIDGEQNAIDYTVEKNVQGNTEDILDQETVDSINATLARTYSSYGIEMYVIMMKTFNFVVKAPLANLPSGTQLFTQRLYDEESNINELRAIHQQLTDQIISGSFSARGRDCLVYSRAEYSGAFAPGKTGTWTLSKRIPYYATTPTYARLNELTDYYYDRIKNNPDVIQAGTQYALRSAASEFFESAKFMALKGRILTTFDNDSMSSIFSQFNEQVDYQNLTEQERIHALAVFSGFAMHDNMNSSEERYACKIIEGTPPEQVSDFLAHLSVNSPLNSVAAYGGDKPDQALIVTLIERVDDVGAGGNNYARMMRALTVIALSDEGYVTSHLPETDDDWIKRRFYWDDWRVLAAPPIGTHDYEVTLNTNATLSVDHDVVSKLTEKIIPQTGEKFYQAEWDTSYTNYSLNPFDLVIVTNRSSLGMLQVSGALPGEPYLAPAIFLQYCSDKAFNTNAIQVTALTLSAVGVIAGPFAIISALEVGNFALATFEGLQFVGSVADIVVNANANAQIQEAVNNFNIVVGIWGVARLGVTGAKYTVDYLAGAKSELIKPVPLFNAREYCTKYDAITNWNGVDEATKARMTKLRELLGEQVAAGHIAVAENMYLEGWSKWKVLSFPKYSRPPVKDYLKASYINAHEALFAQEGAAFIVVKSWLEQGTKIDYPLGKYAMLRSEMDQVLTEYRSTGDIKTIEDGLGYESGSLVGLEDELYVFYVDKNQYDFKMPSGNEDGSNALWEPTGHTSGGKREACIYVKSNPSQKIVHNKSITTLQSIFTEYSKVKND